MADADMIPARAIELKGRVALVTGASREQGLGYALCQALAQEGAIVLLTARDGDAARRLAVRIAAGGGDEAPTHRKVEGHALDVTDPASIAALRETIERDRGRLDILINNAAGMSAFGEEAASADLNAARRAMDVTLFGSWALIEAMLPLLRRSEHGRIVNVSSGAGSHGDPMFGLGTDNSMGAGYGAAKAALNALTHRLAHEEVAREEAGRKGSAGGPDDFPSRLRINAVCPGFTATFEGGEGMGARPPAESAKGVLWAVRLPDDGPTGGFFRDGEPLAW